MPLGLNKPNFRNETGFIRNLKINIIKPKRLKKHGIVRKSKQNKAVQIGMLFIEKS
jgi:hypothetical protein